MSSNSSMQDDRWLEAMRQGLEGACSVERTRHRADTVYLILMGGRIFAMQSGFAMLEAAFVRPMNSANIMMKNMMDLFVGALAFYLFGYALAYGERGATVDETGFDFAMWFLQFSYATTAATIDSGALAGRVSFIAYVLISIVVIGLVQPVVVGWTWGGGWLGRWGYDDFAGGTIVHLVGAVSAMVSICICGPRIGRYRHYRAWKKPWSILFAERNTDEFYRGPQTEIEAKVFSPVSPMHNPVQALFGVFLLLTGFLAFNPASTLSTTGPNDLLAARTSVTTILVTAGGALTSFIIAGYRRRNAVVSIPEFTTNTVAGMVASCGCCHVVPPALCPIVGVVAAILADGTARLLEQFQLDDVVGAVAAHGPPGAWGVLAAAFFARPHCQSRVKGLFFGGGHEAWDRLGISIAGILAIVVFVAAVTYVAVLLVDLLIGFRSNRATELIGHDFMEHGYEDSSTKLDPHKAFVIHHSPTRDCVKERIFNGSSGPKEGPELLAAPPPAEELPGHGDREGTEVDERVVALENQVKQLTGDLRLLLTLLGRNPLSPRTPASPRNSRGEAPATSTPASQDDSWSRSRARRRSLGPFSCWWPA